MKFLLCLVVALSCLYAVSASSSGLLAYCNVDLKYGKGTTVMPWVVPVANATFYTIRSGDIGDVSNDPTSYIPGKLTPIHIRTYDLNRIFIGLQLYAIDSTGKKVGTWTIPTGTPFQYPPACVAVDGPATTVTHSDADLKPLHVVFWWQAPAGTGKVTFKIMIKQGEQNKGWFWYPAKVLSLTEGTAPADDQYVLAGSAETCVSACGKQSTLKYCDATTTALMRGQNSMTSPITAAGAACLLPLLSGCSDMAPFRTSDFHCFYKTDSSVCTQNGRGLTATDANVCHYADSTGQRFCACTSVNGSDVITGTIPTTDDSGVVIGSSTGGKGGVSSAPRSTNGGVIVCLLVAAVGSLFGVRSSSYGSRSATMMMVVALLVAMIAMVAIVPAEAHNWVANPSRATIASVTKPCQRRIGNQPHIQVVANQTFQTEWSVGHGDSSTKLFYFVLVHSDDFDQLLTMTTADLDRYIREAPTSAWMFNSTQWKKRHITATNDPDWIWGYFDKVPLAANDSRYIARDPTMNIRGKTKYPNNMYNEYFFYPNHTIMDARVEYQSINYPWIESVHRFYNSFAEHLPFAHQYNLANFKMPARKGPGDYILHFYWGGYRDCVDVNVQPTTATQTAIVNRYGIYNTSAASTWTKMEHCEFFYVLNPLTPCTLVSSSSLNVQSVLTACMKYGTSCNSVQCARLNNPSTALTWTPGIPFAVHNYTALNAGTSLPVSSACGYPAINDRVNAGCTDFSNKYCNQTAIRAASTSFDDQVCFGLQPFRNQDFQASEDFIITDDPLDPRWYSTCWFKVPNGGFLNTPVIPTPYPDWKAGDNCVTCSYRKQVQAADVNTVSNWAASLTSVCVNCESPDL